MAKILIEVSDGIWKIIKHVEPKSIAASLILKAVKHGTEIPAENGFIAICKPNKPLPKKIKKSLKETLFIADEDCLYNFDMIEIIDTRQEAEHGDE